MVVVVVVMRLHMSRWLGDSDMNLVMIVMCVGRGGGDVMMFMV